MNNQLESLTNYFVGIGVDERLQPYIITNNRVTEKRLCEKLIQLAVTSGNDIPNYVRDILIKGLSEGEQDYIFECKIALNNAIVRNKKKGGN